MYLEIFLEYILESDESSTGISSKLSGVFIICLTFLSLSLSPSSRPSAFLSLWRELALTW